jgi:POT family proton-dependent oligopeptide transporter
LPIVAAELIAVKVAALTAVSTDIHNASTLLAIYSHMFMQIGIATAVMDIMMILTAPELHLMTLDALPKIPK